jgi:hypothetical protein
MHRKVLVLIGVIIAIAVGLRMRVELLSGMSGLPATAVATVAVVAVAAAVVVLFRLWRHLGSRHRLSPRQ